MSDETAPVVTIPTLYARIHLCTTCTTCDTIPCICEEVPRG